MINPAKRLFRIFIGGLCVLSAPSLSRAAESVSGPRPNIIVILADDLGWGDVGFNGRKDYITPNLDRLASQGLRFTRWHTGAVVCGPSRAVLLTGKYTIHCGVTANNQEIPEQPTIASALKKAGYATGIFGKWHGGKPRPPQTRQVNPLDLGFDEYVGIFGARECWEKFPKQMMFGRELKPTDGYATEMFTDHAIDFIERNQNRPFFLYLAYTDPHFNIAAPEKDVDRYLGKFKEEDAKDPVYATYAAMVTRMDAEVGRVVSKLDDLKLADHTLIVFTSDNGATFEPGNKNASSFHDSNHPFRGSKRTLWEGGSRMPAFVRWPGHVPAEKTCEQPVHMADVFPTVLAAANAKSQTPPGLDGLDLLDVWLGKADVPKRTLFWEWRSEGTPMLAAMNGDYKLVISGANGRPELYDIPRDPAERRDISPTHGPIVKRLRAELDAWMKTEKTPPGMQTRGNQSE
jgi:arylsulfatase A